MFVVTKSFHKHITIWSHGHSFHNDRMLCYATWCYVNRVLCQSNEINKK